MKHPLSSVSAVALLLITLAVTPSIATAAKEKEIVPKDAVAVVNGKAIPKSRADFLLAVQKSQGHPETPELRNAIRDNLITREALVQEAIKRGIEKRSDIQTQLEMSRQDVLVNAYLADYVRSHPVSDEQIKKEYDAYRANTGNTEYHARHILVETEDQAKDIIARLQKGETFADLAKLSKDPGSKDKGGDLGWSVPSGYVKPFSDAMTALKKGQYTLTPVKTDFGWHVIKLEDTRDFKAPSLDELKPQIVNALQRQMVEQHIAEIRSKAKVE
ncbi:MAG: peptidylprolyl isomerase [Proteobacteria bacterium]|nr:peptidylprolyl isomerase [Pseudomonadota bacterium]HQR02666.1 peptidylprolyl isomerase [Rhodocyclaceae bacterium]